MISSVRRWSKKVDAAVKAAMRDAGIDDSRVPFINLHNQDALLTIESVREAQSRGH